MKKINTRKLNQYFNSMSNSPEMKGFVQDAVNRYLVDETVDETVDVKIIQFLDDLALLTE